MNHKDFILSPIEKILKELTSASKGVSNGMETFPLSEYIMQSVFLKMTGAQEQKMKCICWDLATNDYEYRYKRYTQTKLGECSQYNEKKIVYKDIIEQIKKNNPNFNLQTINRDEVLSNSTETLDKIFSKSNIIVWSQKKYNDFQKEWKNIKPSFFLNDTNNLFGTPSNATGLKDIYENFLYKKRNKIAHNTQSYQENLPTLSTLNNEKYIFENYFLYFGILILIDKIFIKLYKEYLKNSQYSQ